MKILSAVVKKLDQKYQQMKEEETEGELEASSWSLSKTLSMIDSTSGAKVFGYKKAVDEKVREASDNELKMIFEEAYSQQSAKKIACIKDEMLRRNLLFEDADGKIKANFR